MNGLDLLSIPIVVDGPCPGCTAYESGSDMSLALIEPTSSLIDVPPVRSTLPTLPAKSVSPDIT